MQHRTTAMEGPRPARRLEGVSAAFVLLLGLASGPAAAQSASEERPVAPFSKLVAQNGVDVYLTQSTRESLRVEVEGFDLDDVVATVSEGELRLSNPAQSVFAALGGREARVYLGFVSLDTIQASGGSDIHGQGEIELEGLSVTASGGSDVDLEVRAQSLEFHLSGGSDLRLRGGARSLTVKASGGSDVSARAFDAERVGLSLSGGSDADVRASAAIEVDASGGSDVVIRGNPPQRQIRNDRSSDVISR